MLDVSVQASIMNLLRELQERLGLTYLYITHDIELLGWISHTIGVMQRGRLVEVGSRDQVMEAPVHPYTRELLYSYTHWEGGGGDRGSGCPGPTSPGSGRSTWRPAPPPDDPDDQAGAGLLARLHDTQDLCPEPSALQVLDLRLRPLLRARGVETALEVGPGWGSYTLTLAELCREVACVDLSRDVLDFILRAGGGARPGQYHRLPCQVGGVHAGAAVRSGLRL